MADASEAVPGQAQPSASNKRLYIKSLTISGFRSYSEAKVTNFSARHNCVVGPNGSGKSNFFAALEFVLGEREFSNLSHEDRLQLLHEGAQSEAVLMAYVEVVFDNSEGRLPIDSDEVRLRRTVGLKKDEFFVNNKHIAKQEVEHLLESAGFSKSNPYYICRQGKVAELCTMSDTQRLNLLKEVAGTTVYDAKRKESERLLEEAQKKSQNIDELINNISNRLNDLKQEKEELEQFRELDKQRRGLESALNQQKLDEAVKKIDALEQDRLRLQAELQNRASHADKLSEEVEEIEYDLSTAQSALTSFEDSKKQAHAEYLAATKARTKKELDVRDQEERLKQRTEWLSKSKSELSKIEEAIAEAEHKLDSREGASENKDGLRHQLERARVTLTECRETIRRLEQRETEIRSKQGRTARFGNDVKKRNEFIDEEVKNVKSMIEAKNKAIAEYQEQKTKMAKDKSELQSKLSTCDKELAELENAREHAKAGFAKASEASNLAQAKVKDLRRKRQEHIDSKEKVTAELKKAQQELSAIIPVAVDSGLRALSGICEARNIDQSKVYGPLFSLISCENPAYRTAVEVAAGAQLLHAVVDTDATAAELMEGLLEKKAGRVTFKPLNVLVQREKSRVSSKRRAGDDDDDDDEGPSGGDVQELMKRIAEDSEINAEEAIPLVYKVKYDDKFGPAVRAMLGRTLLCKNHRVASHCAKKYKVDCVTLEGDQVSRRGALTGGFVDTKRSRLAASEQFTKVQSEAAKHEKAVDELNAQVEIATQEHSVKRGEQEDFINKLKRAETSLTELKSQRASLAKSLREMEARLAEMESKASSYAAPTDLIERVKDLEDEKKQPPLAALGEDEKKELLSIPEELAKARALEKELSAKEVELATRVSRIASDLEDNLRRRKEELLAHIAQGGPVSSSASSSAPDAHDEALGGLEGAQQTFENAKAELVACKRDENDAKAREDEIDKKLERETRRVNELSTQVEKKRAEELEAIKVKEEARSALEKIHDQRSEFLRERDRAMTHIRASGMVSTEMAKYMSMSTSTIESKLKKINTELRKFMGVNNRAMEQFVSFSEQKQTLVQRQKEAKEADAKIRQLIEHLDKEKDAAILLTFKQVSRNFREIFSELVPNGVAELRMIKGRGDGEEAEEENNASGVDAFIGVSPRVSFSGSKDTMPMKQLSGGQKALVALTLIFAIQRCDPAPFYLFDEIDQALDSNHRTAVATMIQRQARSTKGAQFITTTFRPELVEVADKWFGIQFSKKVSNVGQIDKEQALKFIKMARVEGGKRYDRMEEYSEAEDQNENEDEAESDGDVEVKASETPQKRKKTRRTSNVEKAAAEGIKTPTGGAAKTTTVGGSRKRKSSSRHVESDDEE